MFAAPTPLAGFSAAGKPLRVGAVLPLPLPLPLAAGPPLPPAAGPPAPAGAPGAPATAGTSKPGGSSSCGIAFVGSNFGACRIDATSIGRRITPSPCFDFSAGFPVIGFGVPSGSGSFSSTCSNSEVISFISSS